MPSSPFLSGLLLYRAKKRAGRKGVLAPIASPCDLVCFVPVFFRRAKSRIDLTSRPAIFRMYDSKQKALFINDRSKEA
jgi:hypothetical protein